MSKGVTKESMKETLDYITFKKMKLQENLATVIETYIHAFTKETGLVVTGVNPVISTLSDHFRGPVESVILDVKVKVEVYTQDLVKNDV